MPRAKSADTPLSLKKLKDYMTSLAHTGEVEVKVSNKTENGWKIDCIEIDEYTVQNKNGEEENRTDMTGLCTLYVRTEDGSVTFIEHPFGTFTEANKEEVIHLVSLIGKKISIE